MVNSEACEESSEPTSKKDAGIYTSPKEAAMG